MERRTKVEFAHCLRHIVAAYSDAEVIRVVLDNLNTHKAASLYAAFPPEEARAIVRNIEFHPPPNTAVGSISPKVSHDESKRTNRIRHSGLDPESDQRECRASGSSLDPGFRQDDVVILVFGCDYLLEALQVQINRSDNFSAALFHAE